MKRAMLAIVLAAAFWLAAPGGAALLADKRLGNNTEAATFVSEGANANHVVMIDGWDVRAIPVEGKGKAPAKTLFDVRSISWGAFPSGIAYVPVERDYVLSDQGNPDVLIAVSDKGTPLPARPVTYLPGTPPLVGVEALVYLPPTSAYPDSLARAVFLADSFDPSIEIMSTQGVVLRELELGGPLAGAYVTGLTYLPTGQFLLSTADQNLWRVSQDGSVLAGPIPVAEAGDIEALAALPNGTVFAADYTAGRLWALDAILLRDPSRDRDISIGVGVSRSFDGIWDAATGTFLLNGIGRDHTQQIVASVSPSLDRGRTLFTLPGFYLGLTHAPGDTLAACPFPQKAIDVFSRSGALVSSVDLAAVVGLPGTRCANIAYVEAWHEYAIREIGRGRSRTVYLVRADGTYGGSFPVATPIATLTASPAGDRLLVYGPDGLFSYDASGAQLSASAVATGPLVHPYGYVAGPGTSYALLDGDNSEMATFSG